MIHIMGMRDRGEALTPAKRFARYDKNLAGAGQRLIAGLHRRLA
jgi:hypothetical protein